MIHIYTYTYIRKIPPINSPFSSKFGESETLERKNTTGGRREAARTICVMLNQRGGYVMSCFGVNTDRDLRRQDGVKSR